MQQDLYRVNRRIRVPQVRVIGADGGQLGVLATDEALRIAEEAGLDLVEVSPKAMPPVCKIMDYGKFKYEDSKKRKDAKKHQSTVTYKEIKFRPKTDKHDLDFKVDHIRRFLLEGNKARLVVIFRGREIVHPETGQAMLKKVIDLTQDIAMVEQPPMMEGRRMLMIIAPRPPGSKPGTGISMTMGRPVTPPAAGAPVGAAPAPGGVAAPSTAPRPASAPFVGAPVSRPPMGSSSAPRPPMGSSSAPRPSTAPRPTGPSSSASRPTGPSSAPRPSAQPSRPTGAPSQSKPSAPASKPSVPVSIKPPVK